MNDKLASFSESVKKWLSTPNGQLRMIGAIMIIGSGYYVMATGYEVDTFVYWILGIGTVFVTISILLAIWKARINGKLK